MARPRATQPTNAELEILRVLWDKGPCSVREVHEALDRGQSVGYTTILKTLQIMSDKNLVRRAEQGRGHVYRAAVAREVTQQRMVNDLIERAFGGSAAGLVMQALSSHPASADELERIKAMVEDARRRESQ